MFQSARLKLTAWYLAIIMCISLFFSFSIYTISTREIEDRLRHIFLQMQSSNTLGMPTVLQIPFNFRDEATGAQENIRNILLEINGVIFIVSGAAAYFLAGRTLKPIQTMVDEQNRFVGDASHEFRTPLTALRTSIEVALRDEKMHIADAREILKSNLEDIEGLQHLSDRLLLLAQFPTQTTKREFTNVSLETIFQEVHKKIAPLAKKKHIVLHFSPAPYFLSGDNETLCELFIIFLDNAIKYSPEKSNVEIHTKKIDGSVLITITDHGDGIAEKDLPHIFDRFYRADTSRAKDTRNGYGLGLSIAKKIIDDYHGSVDVSSTPAKGSSFKITFPSR